ncbi:MAG: hypothetical protein MUC89_08435 [Acetobacteraceae bacterium]|nr:hypothetical protein [Paracoccaceae bacterium]MCU0984956.1 hypothetical protein [Acetobacteraceae bacterium]
MIELKNDALTFRFPHLGSGALMRVSFHRTLRVPGTGKTYPLPADLGRFRLRHVDDYASRLPEEIVRRGGVIMPMWQAEAMWIAFGGFRTGAIPCAVKVAAGKINAVSGQSWRDGLHRDPQDYCVIPGQPWLDGFAVGKGVVRQFVAMPLGAGATAEEQLTGAAEHGGLQIAVTPLTEAAFAAWRNGGSDRTGRGWITPACGITDTLGSRSPTMGLSPGGSIRQIVNQDTRPLDDYDVSRTLRVFVTILDAVAWRHATGELPPTSPPTAQDYARARLPWFELYQSDVAAVGGAPALQGLKWFGEWWTSGGPEEDIAVPQPTMLYSPLSREAKRLRPWNED